METCLLSGADLRNLVRAAEAWERRRRLSLLDDREEAALRRLNDTLARAKQSLEDAAHRQG